MYLLQDLSLNLHLQFFLTIYRRNQPIKLMIISHNLSSDIQIFPFSEPSK